MRNASPWLLVVVLAAAGCTDGGGRTDRLNDDAVWSASATVFELTVGPGGEDVEPPNSECHRGTASYRLDVTAMTLDSSTCVDDARYPTPYKLMTRSRAVTGDELDRLDSLLSDLKVTSEEYCVIDGAPVTLRVTTPSGTSEYADGSHQCYGGPLPFVDWRTLQDVHQALFDLANKI